MPAYPKRRASHHTVDAVERGTSYGGLGVIKIGEFRAHSIVFQDAQIGERVLHRRLLILGDLAVERCDAYTNGPFCGSYAILKFAWINLENRSLVQLPPIILAHIASSGGASYSEGRGLSAR